MNTEEAKQALATIPWPENEDCAAFREVMENLCEAGSPYTMMQLAESAEYLAGKAKHLVGTRESTAQVAYIYGLQRLVICVMMEFTMQNGGVRCQMEMMELSEEAWNSERVKKDQEQQYRSLKTLMGKLESVGVGWRKVGL